MSMAKKILIIDDDARVREGIANYLRTNSQNFEIAAAEDGFDAGLILNNFTPDIIILDLMMPKVDGFKICNKIKNNSPIKDVKIIILIILLIVKLHGLLLITPQEYFIIYGWVC